MSANPTDLRKVVYAAARNKEHILEVLKATLSKTGLANLDTVKVLEVASGSGEHAALMLESIPNLYYQPTEYDTSMHESIGAWTEPFIGRVLPPLFVDVLDEGTISAIPNQFLPNQSDVMICINMIHISPFQCTEALFSLARRALQPKGFLLTYGPYRVNGEMVESNVQFDASLKARNSEWGIRDLEAVEAVAQKNGMQLSETVSMPANNLCLVFTKQTKV